MSRTVNCGLYKYTPLVLTVVPFRTDHIDSRCISVWNVLTAGGKDPTKMHQPKSQLLCQQLSMHTT